MESHSVELAAGDAAIDQAGDMLVDWTSFSRTSGDLFVGEPLGDVGLLLPVTAAPRGPRSVGQQAHGVLVERLPAVSNGRRARRPACSRRAAVDVEQG